MNARPKVTAVSLRRRKGVGPRISMVTVYDATMAALFEEASVDALLVGDSLGMVVQGRDTTLPVTVEEICYHTRAVARVAPRAHLVADLPFMSYQLSPEQALATAGRVVQVGRAEAVKLEGGVVYAAHVRRIVEAGIPVVGHVGLLPQRVHEMGGFRVQGRGPEAAQQVVDDAVALADAGAHAIVVEGVPRDLARRITAAVAVPTIGIGAGPDCDGQVLVCYDLLGMNRALRPRFVRRFAELGDAVVAATRDYVSAVRDGRFPGAEHSFEADDAAPASDGGPEGAR